MKEKDKEYLGDNTEFATVIKRLRKEHNLTQKELADKINVSDRTISKWEHGHTIPDLVSIKNICSALGVSPSSIVHNKKTIKDVLQNFKKSLKSFYNFFLSHIIKIAFIITFILLLFYFINNYNAMKFYNLKYDSENILIDHGFFFKTKVKTMLSIDGITLNKLKYTPVSLKVELYTYINGDKYVLYNSDNLDDIYIKEDDILTSEVIKAIKYKLYMEVTAVDEEGKQHTYSSSISLTDKFKNDKLSYSNFTTNNYSNKTLGNANSQFTINYDKVYSNQKIKDDTYSDNKLKNLGYDYDNINHIYIKQDEFDGTINYLETANVLNYYKFKNNLKYTADYSVDLNQIFYKIYNNNDKIKVHIKYLVNEDKIICKLGKCNNYVDEIYYILRIYKEIQEAL